MKNKLLLIIICIVFISCNRSAYKNESYNATTAFDNAPAYRQDVKAADNQEIKAPVDKRKIIKDGRVSVKVENLSAARKRIDSLVVKYNAYYGNDVYSNNDYYESYDITIRIPAANFEAFMLSFEKGFGEILYKTIEARDVTEEYIDLENRLKTKQNYIKRYSQLLRKANSVKDILEIEEKIRVIQEEIESTTGRMKYLDDQVSYSKLELNLTCDKEFRYKPIKKIHFFEQLKQALSTGWNILIGFILLLVKIWPFIFLIVIAWILILYIRKRKRNKPVNIP